MGIIKGGEEKNPKSWGNGYLRFTLMDIIKIASLLVSATAAVVLIMFRLDGVEHSQKKLEENQKASYEEIVKTRRDVQRVKDRVLILETIQDQTRKTVTHINRKVDDD